MTLLGKFVIGSLAILVASGIFYGVMSYVEQDNIASLTKKEQKKEEVVATSSTLTDASSSELLGFEATGNGTSTFLVDLSVDASSTKQATSSKKSPSNKISFVDFVKKGGDYKCAVTQTVANMTSNGTVYVSNDLVRAEFSTSLAGQTINTTMIARDGYTYTWTSMSQGKGYKAKITQGSSTNTTKATYTWNGSQVGEYSCDPWKFDKTKFDLPKGVTFTEM